MILYYFPIARNTGSQYELYRGSVCLCMYDHIFYYCPIYWSDTSLGRYLQFTHMILFTITVKTVLGGHSKIGKTKILITNGSLMMVESIAKFCNTFDLH